MKNSNTFPNISIASVVLLFVLYYNSIYLVNICFKTNFNKDAKSREIMYDEKKHGVKEEYDESYSYRILGRFSSSE